MDLTNIKGVIFDLDGTLVESRLNFTRMRDDVGCPQDQDILEFVEAITCATTKQQAQERILQHELEDADTAKWLPLGREMVENILQHQLPMAIVTRNCRQATTIKLQNNQVPISLVLTREDAPPKPDPTALLQIASQWQLPPAHCLYVGDFIYDRMAAENAGMRWWLV
ncbi:HAD-IA family hydrolase [Alteromonas sp. ASW11-19]|uniref:HAD-IA family hydrolase n=1 Tax=Alteromonas salexigens TaxID=2982530 RepID=A0ABT2VK60_9ALTE|nr:HAD-IA family hydrolase [Alteromonas salexigens]MCU7553389.1 HAD-IA family hydrolase [Alteromonas salexigens]